MSIKGAQNDFTRELKIFTTVQKMPKNVGDLGKLIVVVGFEKLPKVQYIPQAGHTEFRSPIIYQWPLALDPIMD